MVAHALMMADHYRILGKEKVNEMKEFQIGKVYSWYQTDYDPILVIGRTEKTITVVRTDYFCFGDTWKMHIKIDDEGDESVTDSSVPMRYRDAFTTSAALENGDDGRETYTLWKMYNLFQRTLKNCHFYEESADPVFPNLPPQSNPKRDSALLNEIGCLRGIAYCIEAIVGDDNLYRTIHADSKEFARLCGIAYEMKHREV